MSNYATNKKGPIDLSKVLVPTIAHQTINNDANIHEFEHISTEKSNLKTISITNEIIGNKLAPVYNHVNEIDNLMKEKQIELVR